MTPEIQKKHDDKEKRINDAIALKEPDRVPITPNPQLYPIFHSGYTVAEVVYDSTLEKIRNALINYHIDFEPDSGTDIGQIYAGEGPIMDTIRSKNMRLAGMGGEDAIDENSLQQFIEYPLLLDDEFDEFFKDRMGWAFRKAMPRMSDLFAPLAGIQYGFGEANRVARQVARAFSTSEFSKMVEDFRKIDDFYTDLQKRADTIHDEIMELGFPMMRGIGGGLVPFDSYSDFLRGTILAMEDFFERPDYIERYIDETWETTEAYILSTKGKDEGKHVFIPLHKGFDGFMSGEFYGKYYWKHLQKLILALIESGKVPYIYTEGKYNTRLDFLTDVPPGKVFYHFEDVDMAAAKKKLGGIACISGGFPAALLDWGTPQMVREEAKRLLDVCAPGGGFIFETSCGMAKCKRENVETMFETVKEFGVY